MADKAEISGPELEATWRTIVTGVTRLQQRIDAAVEESGVNPTWFAVLHELLLARDHRVPMSSLATDVAMTPGGFSKLADRMAREGLIDRRGSASDRRVIHVALTPDGLALARRARRAHAQALRSYVLEAMSSKELAASAVAFGRVDRPAAKSDGRAGRSAAHPAPGGGSVTTDRRRPGAARR